MQKFKTAAAEPYRALADSIAANLKTSGGTISEEVPHSTYDANLPEGITRDTVKAMAKYNNNFIQASRLAVAEASVAIFNQNSTIDTVNAELGFFAPGDNVRIRAERERTYVNPQAAEGQPATLTKSLVLSYTVSHRGQSGKALRDAISTEAAEMFKR